MNPRWPDETSALPADGTAVSALTVAITMPVLIMSAGNLRLNGSGIKTKVIFVDISGETAPAGIRLRILRTLQKKNWQVCLMRRIQLRKKSH